MTKDKKTTRRQRGEGSKTRRRRASNRWLLACRRDSGIVYRADNVAVMRQRDATQGGGALAADQRPGDFSRSRVAGDFSPQPKGGGVFSPKKTTPTAPRFSGARCRDLSGNQQPTCAALTRRSSNREKGDFPLFLFFLYFSFLFPLNGEKG